MFDALILQSLLDRLVQNRRAAAAVLQEAIGRGLAPDGDELVPQVLREIDFFTVTTLRLQPVLGRIGALKGYLLRHLLPSADAGMRSFGAACYAAYCRDEDAVRAVVPAPSFFARNGALLALKHMGCTLDAPIPDDLLRETAIGVQVQLPAYLDVVQAVPDAVLVRLLAFRFPEVREAVIRRLHLHPDIWPAVEEALRSPGSSPTHRLGCLEAMAVCPRPDFELLASCASAAGQRPALSIEARRAAVQSIARNTGHALPARAVAALLDLLRHDYTIDDRGDVGSWVRMACMQALMAHGVRSEAFVDLLREQAYARIDRLRSLAREALAELRCGDDPHAPGYKRGIVYGWEADLVRGAPFTADDVREMLGEARLRSNALRALQLHPALLPQMQFDLPALALRDLRVLVPLLKRHHPRALQSFTSPYPCISALLLE